MGVSENFAELLDYLANPAGFQTRRRFTRWARAKLSLPAGGGVGPGYLPPEAWWQALLAAAPEPDTALAALSRATGLYFFPSREWPPRLMRFLKKLRVTRLLEAGAGRGYVSEALAPLAREAGLQFLAVDRGDGEFAADLPASPLVRAGDAFHAARTFRPQAIFYAWPPPGQSVLPFFDAPEVRYVIVAGEAGGGVTGSRKDWELLPHKKSGLLSRFCRGRAGQAHHQVTIFWQPDPESDRGGRDISRPPGPVKRGG